MPSVTGPLLSLSASGVFGKTILYYDTKYGARARKVKGFFEAPGNIWEVNKEWFKKASDRWKLTLPQDAKWAWNLYSESLCDVGRDIFMGHQIEYWNISEVNDLIWPVVDVNDVGDFTITCIDEGDIAYCYFREYDKYLIQENCPATIWAIKLDDDTPASDVDIVLRKQNFTARVSFIPGHINYIWGGVRYTNGTYKMLYLGSFSK